jgi:hypothetical protein
MTTIVSCFLANSNSRPDRIPEKYIELGKKLLKIKTPKIVFIDESIIGCIEYDANYTRLIPFRRDDIYLYMYKDNITNFNIVTDFKEKDTLDYMLLICNKTEIMRKAIEINHFKTEQFVWVDFGINHVFRCSDIEFEKKILNIVKKDYKNVRIGSIIDPRLPANSFKKDIYREIAWYFAGGVFGGSINALIEFANLVKEKSIETIFEKNTIMWEVNIWYLVFLENKKLFDLYFCDHNETLVTLY